ncbi:nucleotide-binding protein, partial [Bacteroides uniformis]
AIVANAKFIVTEDHHFHILKQYNFPKVSFIGLDDFCHSL